MTLETIHAAESYAITATELENEAQGRTGSQSLCKKFDLKHKMNNLENIHRNNTEGESWR